MKRHQIPLLLFGLGLVLIGIGLIFPQQSTLNKKNKQGLATVENTYGDVYINQESRPLDRARPVVKSSRVETKSGTEAEVTFETGEKVRVLENTVITLDREAQKPLIVIQRGQILPMNEQAKKSIVVAQEGLRLDIQQYLQQASQSQAQGRPSLLEEIKAEVQGQTQENLSFDELIQSTLALQKQNFTRCFNQYLQSQAHLKSLPESGHAKLYFTLSPKGHPQEPRVTTTNMNDQDFKKCLVQVLERTQFKYYSGEPLQVIFPIQFE